jgi:hypothetical protein
MPNKESENNNTNVEDKKSTEIINEALEANSENNVEPKNNNFLRKILIYVIAFLISVLVIISIFYIFNLFMSKEEDKSTQVVIETPEKTVENQTQPDQLPQQEEPKHEEYSFDFNTLDPDKLNEQLALLTNKNIEQSRLEKIKAENEKKLLEEKKLNEPISKSPEIVDSNVKNENIKNSNENPKNNATEQKAQNDIKADEKIETTQNQQNKKEQNSTQQDIIADNKNSNNNDFIKLINIAKIKGELKKNFLDKIIAINPNVHLCRDEENIIELYFGPFSDDETRKELYNKLVSKGFKEAYELEMTQEAFDKSCNY